MFLAPLLVQSSPAGTALTGGLVAASLQLLARMVPIRINLKKSVLSVYFVWLTMGSLTWERLSLPLCVFVLSTVLFIVTSCHLQCNEWICDLLCLLNPSCSFFSRWPWFISPSDLVAITVSADISPACPVPLHLAACETNACRQYSHTSCLPGLVSVGLNSQEVLCEAGDGSATELCLDKKSSFSCRIICILQECTWVAAAEVPLWGMPSQFESLTLSIPWPLIEDK